MKSANADDLLRSYAKVIVFLRGQRQRKRLNLALGAGTSVPLKFPSWPKLVSKIGEATSASHLLAGKLEKATLTAKAQYLFEHFYRQQMENNKFNDERFKKEEARARWNKVLRDILYEGVDKIEAHPYLRSVLKLKPKLIVNYNFDDTVERLVEQEVPTDQRSTGKPYNSTWTLAEQTEDKPLTILHPNGYIPFRRHDYASERIVFSDETFSNQISIENNSAFSLLNTFLQNSFLLLGISLEDVTIRQLLRRAALSLPGHHHVIVVFDESGKAYSDDQRRAITSANFEVYNLLTMFLDSDGIASLTELILEDDAEFLERAERLGIDVKFVYYITGGVAAGKTTVVTGFRSCYIYEEWVEPSPDVVSKPFSDLTDDEKIDADRWIGKQFHLKNRALRSAHEGIYIVDRGPLDPLSFETKSEKDRAAALIETYRPGLSGYEVERGQVILLRCPAKELKRRLISKDKHWLEKTIEENCCKLEGLYEGAITIDSFGVDELVTCKEIARQIFCVEYHPVDLDVVLERRASA